MFQRSPTGLRKFIRKISGVKLTLLRERISETIIELHRTHRTTKFDI